MPDALLTIEGVSAFYGHARALEDVSFEITGGAVAEVDWRTVVTSKANAA